MRIIDGFEEQIYKEIARSTGNSQLVKDVSYMRIIKYNNKPLKAERLEKICFYIGYHNSDHFRLVGIGVSKEKRGNGYGRFMLYRAIDYARKNGYKKIRTRTSSGVDFYQKFGGGKIIDMIDNDFVMEMEI